MKTNLGLAVLGLLAMNGCAMTSGGNAFATGFIYSDYKSPGQVGTAQATKTGEACIMSILGFIAIGDASVETAKQAGGISQIAYIDHHETSIITLYAKSCTVVHGQ